jgi:fluoride exporter
LQRYLLIAIGGAVGSMLRYFIGLSAAERFGNRFPIGTLLINLAACLLIGFSLEYLNHHAAVSPAWRFLIPIGFIGGFSTFSAFEWEAWASISSGEFWIGILYVAVSVIGGFIAVAAGASVARSLQ